MKITVTRLSTDRDAVIEYACPLCGPFDATFAAGADAFVHNCNVDPVSTGKLVGREEWFVSIRCDPVDYDYGTPSHLREK